MGESHISIAKYDNGTLEHAVEHFGSHTEAIQRLASLVHASLKDSEGDFVFLLNGMEIEVNEDRVGEMVADWKIPTAFWETEIQLLIAGEYQESYIIWKG